MDDDAPVLFRDAQANYAEYPAQNTVVRTAIFGHSLDSFLKRLKEKEVFHKTYRSLGFVDLHEGTQAFNAIRDIDTVKKLEGYLNDDDGAPLWRMVFLQSKTSRDSLGCTREQLSLLLTYYQVMPSFLDLVLTFESRARPLNRAMFRHEDYLAEDAEHFALPELGRSGMIMQHAFNLLSIERNERAGTAGDYFQRQVAMYHSFDVQNGRSLWIVLKGNSLIARRFLASAGTHRHLKAKAINSPETSFIAALHIHLMMMDWCVEDWADYIDHLENLLENMSSDARMAHVDEATETRGLAQTYGSRRTSTMRSQAAASRQGTFERPESRSLQNVSNSGPPSPMTSSKRTFTRSFSDLLPAMRRLSTFKSHRTKKSWPTDVESGTIAEQQNGVNGDEEEDEMNAAAELADLSKNFSFKQFQRLNNLGDEVEQARVAIEQNKGVLEELRQHYEEVVSSYGFNAYIKVEKCRSETAAFFRRVKSVERELDIHYGRLNSLARALDNEKTMFTSILQYKSEKTSEYFASSAKQSSDRMEQWTLEMHKIAVKTEQETVSMHVITVFTLIFLPGTFLATFFSSGILDWDNNNISWADVEGQVEHHDGSEQGPSTPTFSFLTRIQTAPGSGKAAATTFGTRCSLSGRIDEKVSYR
ncbi:unnamed protein product [Discula destructiva]